MLFRVESWTLCPCVSGTWTLSWSWCRRCCSYRNSYETPYRMETWKRHMASVESPSLWERTIQSTNIDIYWSVIVLNFAEHWIHWTLCEMFACTSVWRDAVVVIMARSSLWKLLVSVDALLLREQMILGSGLYRRQCPCSRLRLDFGQACYTYRQFLLKSHSICRRSVTLSN